MYRIGIIGLGKIAQDQHLPVIAKNSRFELAATVSQRGMTHSAVPSFRTPAEMYAAVPKLDAVAICTPPSVRHDIAAEALAAGKHVLLEKPPAATLAELFDLVADAQARKRVLFATWHSQFNAAVIEAKRRLASQAIRSLDIEWKEDVRRWHPGQEWIWRAGGFGVFDPGINALSIVTRIMPKPIFIASADLAFPENRDAPIAASLIFKMADVASGALRAQFDWRKEGEQIWNINVDFGDGHALMLSKGGARLAIDGKLVLDEPPAEYEGIYDRFGDLLDSGEIDVDPVPLELVADAFMLGRRLQTEAFD